MAHSLHYDCRELETFKRSWPCHGLPADLDSLTFVYASNGDLVDIEAKDENGNYLDSATFDGPALVALSEGKE